MDNSQRARGRLVFIDALRLLAIVQMIQGHSVASVLAPAYRSGVGYGLWTFARGLTSVAFLSTAGLAYVLAEQRGHTRSARAARAKRALRLIAIGYLMHAPFGALLGAPLAKTLRAALAVDVLQCIGVSLLGLELLTLAITSPRMRAALALALGLGLFALAPSLHGLSFEGPGLVLGNYLTVQGGSLFPLVPWAGYVLIAFGLGSLAFLRPGEPWPLLAGFGGATLALGALGRALLPAVPAASHPGYCLVKLGCVLLVAALLAYALRSVARLPTLLARLAAESLFLYVSHVVILYADHVGLEPLLRDRHGPLTGLVLALSLLVVCGAGALGFRSLRPRARSGTRAAPSP